MFFICELMFLTSMVSAGMGDRLFPIWEFYLGMYWAIQVNSSWPSLRAIGAMSTELFQGF